MSRLTVSVTLHSAALVLHVCRRSWKVKSLIPASAQALRKACLMSFTCEPVIGLPKIYPSEVASVQRASKICLTDLLKGTQRGFPFLVCSMISQFGSNTILSPFTLNVRGARLRL